MHRWILTLAGCVAFAGPAAASELPVVASIKPVHALVASVMEGVGTPTLLIPASASPHTFSLAPSQARALSRAKVVFWIGHELETALEKPIESLSENARVVGLAEVEGITKRSLDRDEHDDGHEKDDHHDAKKDDDHDHGHGHAHDAKKQHDHDDAHAKEDHAEDKHDDHDHGHGHAHGSDDVHIWLDPENARAMVSAIRDALSAAAPEHAAVFKANAKTLDAELAQLTARITEQMAPVRNHAYIVFHDALMHFEDRFGLTRSNAITISPERRPSARRIAELRHEVKDRDVRCIFIEPQFDPGIAEVVAEGSSARIATVDILGANLEAGADRYGDLIDRLAGAMHDCLDDH
jgi:zinc transport system substrate-binding protein